jgi:hypothetical protein
VSDPEFGQGELPMLAGLNPGGPCWILKVCEVAWVCKAEPDVVVLAHCVAVWLIVAVPFPDVLYWTIEALCVPLWVWSDVPEGGAQELAP